jgi:hypothetical protein
LKKNLSSILAAAACILIIVCLFQIASLKRQVSDLEGNLRSQMNIVSNHVSNLYSSIDSRLEEQASLLVTSTWEFGDADYSAKTVELLCAVTPKEYSSGTEAAIVIDGAEHDMTLSGGEFTAVVGIPLFGETNAAKVVFRDGDSVRTEMLDWYLSPRYDYLPSVYADFNGSGTGSPRDGVYTLHRDGVVNVQVDCKQDYGVESVTLVEILDGQELGRTDIPLDNAYFFENYQNESGARPEPAQPVEAPAQRVGTAASAPFYYALDKAYEIPFGSTLTLYIEVVDENGLRYRCIIDRQEISESGEPMDAGYWRMGREASIYNTDGNALYEPDPEQYR